MDQSIAQMGKKGAGTRGREEPIANFAYPPPLPPEDVAYQMTQFDDLFPGLSFTRWLGGIVPVRPAIYGPQTVFTPHQYQPLCPPLSIPQIGKLHQQQIPAAAATTSSSSPIQSASSVVSAISPPPPASITPVGSPIRTPPLRLNSKDRSSSP